MEPLNRRVDSVAEEVGATHWPVRQSTKTGCTKGDVCNCSDMRECGNVYPVEHDPDTIEAVAIAICNADWPDASDPWNTQWNDRGRQRYRGCAVAALDALEQGSYENWDGTVKPFRTARWRQ